MSTSLLVVHVYVSVLRQHVEAFKAASIQNASASVQEPGVARFDVMQDQADPTQFVLVEAYRSAEAPAAHKETAHYQAWRDTVAPMMASPRQSRRLHNVFPPDTGW